MKNILLALPALLALNFTSCTTQYYTPNMLNVPMFKDQGELHLNGSLSIGDEIEGIEAQAAYSLTPRVGIMANFISASGGEKEKGENYGFGKMAELGVGYIIEIDHNIILEAFTGAGFGNVKTGVYDYSWAKANFTRFFFQPSVSYGTKHFEIGFATRFAYLSYNNLDVYFPNGNISFYERDLADREYFLAEPAVVIRGGLKNVKLQAQFAASFIKPELPQGDFNLSLGIAVSLDNLGKKKE